MASPARPRDPEPLDYDQLVRELFPRLTGGIRWGLDRTRALLAAADDPHLRYPILHIGGTNGKGSVAATAESILRRARYRTGLYTSPHLTSFRERVRIDGTPIDADALVEAANELWPAIRREEPSFFEATTAIAFLAFARAGVDVAVVEVGLGGRLDATNLVRPDIAVVTQVSREHTSMLGDTLPEIAREKAGIAKSGVPLLTAQPAGSAHDTMRQVAGAAGAPFVPFDPDELTVGRMDRDGTRFRLGGTRWGALELHTPLHGAHQALNAALAVRAVDLSSFAERVQPQHVRDGVRETRWPGRFQIEEVVGRPWVFDVAHNPAAAEQLVRTLEALDMPRPWLGVVAILEDKEWRPMLETLAGALDSIILTRPEHAPAERVWDPAVAMASLGARGVDRAGTAAGAGPTVVEPLPAAIEAAHGRGFGTAVVTGSFHTVGEAWVALGLDIGWEADAVSG